MPRNHVWPRVVVGLLLALWLGVSCLLIVSRGNPERLLRETFAGASRPDAFGFINSAIMWFWLIHSVLLVLAASALRCRRPDVLVALLIGPVIGLGIGAVSQDWQDPNWSTVVGISIMGWIASVAVGLMYWMVRREPPQIDPGAEANAIR